MSSIFIRRLLLVLLFLLSLPILLFVYQPAWKLGGFGLILGAIGYTVSPIILFVTLLGYIARKWSKKRDESTMKM